MARPETIEVETEFTADDDEPREADQQLLQAFRQNEKLLQALHGARDEIAALRDEVDRLAAPPSSYGVYLAAHEDDTVASSHRVARCGSGFAPPSRRPRCGRDRSWC